MTERKTALPSISKAGLDTIHDDIMKRERGDHSFPLPEVDARK